MNLPTLYKLTSTGKLQQWTISVVGRTIHTAFGQTSGKIQHAEDEITVGKNIGRSNETTPEQQAALEAEAKWTKQLKASYVKTVKEANAGGSSDLIAGGVLPMLAKKYWEHPKKVVWPAYIQPKLDGHRCLAIVDANGKCELWSRTRHRIVSVPHIVKAIEDTGITDVTLDGELYNHKYHDNFEVITHLANQKTTPCPGGKTCRYAKETGETCPGYTAVQYHIYDQVLSMTFATRSYLLSSWKDDNFAKASYSGPLVIVETLKVADVADMELVYEEFMESGYEGAILRNATSMYQHKKCFDLLKVKMFDDEEFEVIEVKPGKKGKMKDQPRFVCKIGKNVTDTKATQGATFTCPMNGKLSETKKYLDDPSLAVGRQLTVQYQGFTNKEGVPRFPKGLRFREDI
jgi:DNA ligase 1